MPINWTLPIIGPQTVVWELPPLSMSLKHVAQYAQLFTFFFQSLTDRGGGGGGKGHMLQANRLWHYYIYCFTCTSVCKWLCPQLVPSANEDLFFFGGGGGGGVLAQSDGAPG